MVLVADTKIEGCLPGGEKSEMFDFTHLEFVPENDTLTMINGTWKFLKDVDHPWYQEFLLQMYDRGEWLLRLKKTYFDMCNDIHSQFEMGYFLTKKFPACPIKAGTETYFDMLAVLPSENFLDTIPPQFAGRWRAVMIGQFVVKGKTYKNCHRIYFDLYDI